MIGEISDDNEQDNTCLLLTKCGRARLGNMEDPKYTLGTSVPKSPVAEARQQMLA